MVLAAVNVFHDATNEVKLVKVHTAIWHPVLMKVVDREEI